MEDEGRVGLLLMVSLLCFSSFGGKLKVRMARNGREGR